MLMHVGMEFHSPFLLPQLCNSFISIVPVKKVYPFLRALSLFLSFTFTFTFTLTFTPSFFHLACLATAFGEAGMSPKPAPFASDG